MQIPNVASTLRKRPMRRRMRPRDPTRHRASFHDGKCTVPIYQRIMHRLRIMNNSWGEPRERFLSAQANRSEAHTCVRFAGVRISCETTRCTYYCWRDAKAETGEGTRCVCVWWTVKKVDNGFTFWGFCKRREPVSVYGCLFFIFWKFWYWNMHVLN